MGKFGEVYNRLVTELLPAAPLVIPPAIKAVGGAAAAAGARTAVTRGLAALGGGLAATMNAKNAVKPQTKTTTKTKRGSTELVPTKSKALPEVGEPIIKSKFDECYDRISKSVLTELRPAPPMSVLGGRVGTGAIKPPVSPTTTYTTYTSPGPTIKPPVGGPLGPGPSPMTQLGRAGDQAVSNLVKSVAKAAPILAGDIAAGTAGAAFPIAATGAALGAGQQSMQRFGQKMQDLGVSAPNRLAPGTVGITGAGPKTTPTSPATQPDLQPGTLTTSPAADAVTLNVQAQPQTATQTTGKFDTTIKDLIGTVGGLAAATAALPQAQGQKTTQQTKTQNRRPDVDLVPTSSKPLPGVDEPMIQSKFFI